jgi:hypothetical protein
MQDEPGGPPPESDWIGSGTTRLTRAVMFASRPAVSVLTTLLAIIGTVMGAK